MCTYLVKGQRIDLANYLGNSSMLSLVFGWADSSISLDVSAFPLGSSEKVQFDDDFVFYNNPSTFDGGIILAQDGKSINVDLAKIPDRISKIAFSLSIYDDDKKVDNFSKIHGAYVQILSTVTKRVLLQYNLSQDMFSNERAIVAFEIYKYKNSWKFAAVGSGFTNGLAGICNLYGLEVESPSPSGPSTSKSPSVDPTTSSGTTKPDTTNIGITSTPTITTPTLIDETANTTSRPLNLKKTWDKRVPPLRHLVLWGWDENQNPSFLVLYGEHEFKKENVLCDDVKYDKYLIFKGKEGHLPTFKSIKKMNSCDFSHLAPYEKIVLPYFTGLTYEQVVEKIEFQNTKFHGFRIAKNPNMVIKLPEYHSQHFDLFVGILGNQNIYIRKKMLSQLVKSNPPKEIYMLLFSIASTEALSGLFLELAKTSNPILLGEAKALIPVLPQFWV